MDAIVKTTAPEVGDYILVRATYLPSIRRVTKVTAKRVIGLETGWSHEYHADFDSVLFFGTEAQVKKVAERLQSSMALKQQEERASFDRWEKRDKQIIAKAIQERDGADTPLTQGI